MHDDSGHFPSLETITNVTTLAYIENILNIKSMYVDFELKKYVSEPLSILIISFKWYTNGLKWIKGVAVFWKILEERTALAQQLCCAMSVQ